jgi:hypothetical protein
MALQLRRVAEILFVLCGAAAVFADVFRIAHQFFDGVQIILYLTDMLFVSFSALGTHDVTSLALIVSR